METQEEHCPCCHNHCSRDSLRCPKGRKYFESSAEKQREDNKSGTLLYALMEAGHALRHIAKHRGHIDEDEILADLSIEEQEELAKLISRLRIEPKRKKHRHRH